MAVGGYRVTESDDVRILESGELRITENLYEMSTSLSASGGFDFLGQLNADGNAAFAGNASLVTSGNVIRYGASMVANNSSIDASAIRTTVGNVALAAVGDMSVTSKLNGNGAVALSASGTLSPSARTVKFVFVVSGNEQFLRILENEDYRVTESGDSRITNAVPTNEIVGSLVANDTYIPFSSTAYYKTGGVWKQTDVDAKYNGNWDALQAVYKKISGSWKRIY
jgi:hypothetical protein